MARLNCDCGQELTGSAFPQVCISCGKVIHDPIPKRYRLQDLPGFPFDVPEPKPGEAEVYAKAKHGIRDYTAEELSEKAALADPVNHPFHYTSHASGIEVIQITEHMGFCLGNAVKYILRCDLKGNAIEDLEKSVWYIKREIERRKGQINEAKS